MTEFLETLVTGLVALYVADDSIVIENAIESLRNVVKVLDSSFVLEALVFLKRAVNTLYNKATEHRAEGQFMAVPGLENPQVCFNILNEIKRNVE